MVMSFTQLGGILAMAEIAETSEELPHQKQKYGMPLKKLLKGGQWEAFTKDSDIVQRARGACLRTNHPDFNCEIMCDLSHTFWEMADSAGLLESDIYKVQDAWTGQKDLCTANHTVKASQKNIQFFCLVTPTKLPCIMGLEGIHSLEALCRWGSHSYCPWCAKEGQNEGTVVNHLHTVHYYLGLVCALCLAFSTTSADTMRKHNPCCKATATQDQEEEEMSEEDDGNNDDGYLPQGVFCQPAPSLFTCSLWQWWHECPKLPDSFRTLILF